MAKCSDFLEVPSSMATARQHKKQDELYLCNIVDTNIADAINFDNYKFVRVQQLGNDCSITDDMYNLNDIFQICSQTCREVNEDKHTVNSASLKQ